MISTGGETIDLGVFKKRERREKGSREVIFCGGRGPISARLTSAGTIPNAAVTWRNDSLDVEMN